MNLITNYTENEFLTKWIYRQLTFEEESSFINSEKYKNLVASSSKPYFK